MEWFMSYYLSTRLPVTDDRQVLRMVSYVLGLTGFVASKRAAGHLLAEVVSRQRHPYAQERADSSKVPV